MGLEVKTYEKRRSRQAALECFNETIKYMPLLHIMRITEKKCKRSCFCGINPEYVAAWYDKGKAFILIGHLADAKASFAKAKELDYYG
jgi:tetratricopeptide (TPR) repeat protein